MKKKVLFRDEPFWFKTHKNSHYTSFGSWIRVYVKREGFWSIFSSYKCVSKAEGRWDHVSHKNTLKALLLDAYEKTGKRPILIECSPMIEALYKDITD